MSVCIVVTLILLILSELTFGQPSLNLLSLLLLYSNNICHPVFNAAVEGGAIRISQRYFVRKTDNGPATVMNEI